MNLNKMHEKRQWQIETDIAKIKAGRVTCCLSCEHWVTKDGYGGCGLANGARPPDLVIMVGCPSYYDAIPF